MASERLEDLPIQSYFLRKLDTGADILIEQRRQREGESLWTISQLGFVLNKMGKWEEEPIPSSRTDSYISRTRFASAEEALEFWNSGDYKSLMG